MCHYPLNGSIYYIEGNSNGKYDMPAVLLGDVCMVTILNGLFTPDDSVTVKTMMVKMSMQPILIVTVTIRKIKGAARQYDVDVTDDMTVSHDLNRPLQSRRPTRELSAENRNKNLQRNYIQILRAFLHPATVTRLRHCCHVATKLVANKVFMIRSRLRFKPEFTSRGLKKISKKLPPLGIELTTLTVIRSKVECLSTEAWATWQTLNWSLFHAPFHIWKIIKTCLM